MGSYPLAVKMIEREKDIPTETQRPLKDFGYHISQCQAFAMSRRSKMSIAVLIRKAYGGAKPAMGIDKDIGVDHISAWPTGESAILGAEAVSDPGLPPTQESDNF